MADVVDMVVDTYDGSLKAEHGTGRNMAPFVEKEWGSAAYELMKDCIRLHCIDPESLITEVESVHWLFRAVPECQLLVNEALRFDDLWLFIAPHYILSKGN